ncbi:MAG TPA: nickel pincer cofactor biosynthesis protein LarB [Methanobacteriaceae archaeon]|jgi:NCAIR mutase (PurE)-related protein|nr:nickel pincer cofactor biosynthesis protein LarB [Methanobacteriaceae archaeon]HNS24470.1 nickel pincer cofactor biosynthesis protein LarB [Methanobacteriaceae archaeon]
MRDVLQQVLAGKISLKEAEKKLKSMQIKELGDFAKLDTARKMRTGFPEAIYAEGKEEGELIQIIKSCSQNGRLLVTRLSLEQFEKMKSRLDELKPSGLDIEYNPRARVLVVMGPGANDQENEKIGKIGLITAGTSDIPVAEEARVVAEVAGCQVISAYDVGVAGIHRLFSQITTMIDEGVKAIIVVAGMEGALPSVVAGLVDVPVIGVPTSVGYGVGEGGFAALYAMLQSCAPGIAVVNIDNGFGAAVFAATILRSSIK